MTEQAHEHACPRCQGEAVKAHAASDDPVCDGEPYFYCADEECGWDSDTGEMPNPEDFW